MSDLNQLQQKVGAWAVGVFPDSTDESKLRHFAEESIELVGLDIMRDAMARAEANPEQSREPDLKEIPDPVLILLHLMHCHNMPLWELLLLKFEIIQHRKWRDDGRGYARHVEATDGGD